MILALLVGCALRRQELASLDVKTHPGAGGPLGAGGSRREGKGRRIRTVAEIEEGTRFRH